MSVLNKKYFHNEKAARKQLEGIIWPNGPICPHCGNNERIYDLKKTRPGLRKCGKCRKQFTVTVGTVFESSHIPLHKWFQAVYLMCSSKKGISAHQLHRTLEVTYKTAWFMCHRIREALKDTSDEPLGGLGKIVEVDETYLGPKPRNSDYVYVNGVGWRRFRSRKQMVVSLVERGGRAKSGHVNELKIKTIKPLVFKNVDRKSDLMTDESVFYKGLGKQFKSHQTVNHRRKEYSRGNVTTNTIEGFFSIFKRGMKGIYHHCGERHLHRYLAEFDFWYSERKTTDLERTGAAMRGIVGKRLIYETPSKRPQVGIS